jgi:hypothetical protein
VQANDDTTKLLLEVMKPQLLRDFGLQVNRIVDGIMIKEVNMGRQEDAQGGSASKAYSPFMLSRQMLVIV